MGRGVYRNYYKGHMDKTKVGVESGEGGGDGQGQGEVGGKGRKLYLNNNKIILKKLNRSSP